MLRYLYQDYLDDSKGKLRNVKTILRCTFAINRVGKVNIWIRANSYFSNSSRRLFQLIGRHCYNHLLSIYNLNISSYAQIGRGLKMPHPIGIVIGSGVKIGSNVTIYHGVTIGRKSEDTKVYPVISDNVVVYANSSILGEIELGESCVVGAHSLVLQSTENNSVYVGNPARRIK